MSDKTTDPEEHPARKKPVLRDLAYQRLMDELFSGNLRPGLLISQRALCEQTNSTIGAIREALKRLEAESVVTFVPQRGVMIKELNDQELEDIYNIRIILESHCAKLYAEQGDLQTIANIKSQTREIQERKPVTVEENAQLARERIAVDDLLHMTLIEHLGNAVVLDEYNKLRVQLQVNRLGVQPRFSATRPALAEHLKVIEAIEVRDGDEASRAMIAHLEAGRRRALGFD